MLKFLCNYLRDRKQRVSLNNIFSDTLAVQSGVPQGSILRPLLFVLFINDIYENLSVETKASLSADDTKIWRQMNTYSDCYALQHDINMLEDSCTHNKMKFIQTNAKSSKLHIRIYHGCTFYHFPNLAIHWTIIS